MIDDWLYQNKKSRAWLASEVEITEASLSRIINGHQTPSLAVAVKIEAITGVPPKDMLPAKDDAPSKAGE